MPCGRVTEHTSSVTSSYKFPFFSDKVATNFRKGFVTFLCVLFAQPRLCTYMEHLSSTEPVCFRSSEPERIPTSEPFLSKRRKSTYL